MKKYLLSLVVLLCLGFQPAQATEPFEPWLAALKRDAIAQGVSQDTVRATLSNIKPIPRIIELDRKQPEGTMTFAQYQDRVINQQRINTGRHLYQKHKAELDKVSAKYGVPPQVIVALWGIETSYGDNTGGFGVVEALATLAHDGRRSEFFRKELMNALKIIDGGHISASAMKGSWAGAMGQINLCLRAFTLMP